MLKSIRKAVIICAAIFTLSTYAPVAHAENMINAGATGVWISSPYRGHDDLTTPFPLIHLEAKHFYIRGFSAGVFLWTDDYETNELSVGLTIGDVAFNNADTHDVRLSLLDDRDRTLDLYLQYILRTEFGNLGARVAYDSLGNAKGFVVDTFYKYPIILDSFTITPGAGFLWESDDRVDYFYGITPIEASRSGLFYYSPKAGLSPFLSLDAKIIINENLNLFAAARMRFLSDEIEDSPMVNDDRITFATIGVAYSF